MRHVERKKGSSPNHEIMLLLFKVPQEPVLLDGGSLVPLNGPVLGGSVLRDNVPPRVKKHILHPL